MDAHSHGCCHTEGPQSSLSTPYRLHILAFTVAASFQESKRGAQGGAWRIIAGSTGLAISGWLEAWEGEEPGQAWVGWDVWEPCSSRILLTSFLPAPLPPPQLLRMFFRQQDEIRRLKEELTQKDIRLRQLQLELKNLRNNPKNC